MLSEPYPFYAVHTSALRNRFVPLFPQPRCRQIIDGLKSLQSLVKEVLEQDQKIYKIAEKLHKVF